MKKVALLGSAYLGPVEYYAQLLAHDEALIEQYDHYRKQTYRNRCVIASADGPLALTIPTEKSETPKCLMKDVRVSDHGNWRHQHWNAFVAAYKQSPFFDYYADEFHQFFEKKYEFLLDFNQELMAWVCEQIDIQPKTALTTDYVLDAEAFDDYRETISPKCHEEGEDASFIAKPYYQVFDAKYDFLPNLSIADLLFNMGPESLLVLRDCCKSAK